MASEPSRSMPPLISASSASRTATGTAATKSITIASSRFAIRSAAYRCRWVAPGEIVVTTLTQGWPLIRFGTGDVAYATAMHADGTVQRISMLQGRVGQ